MATRIDGPTSSIEQIDLSNCEFGDEDELLTSTKDEDLYKDNLHLTDSPDIAKDHITQKMCGIYTETNGPEKGLMADDDITFEQCLDILLGFALAESSRKTIISGVKKYDGLTVPELIQKWCEAFPTVRWVLTYFNNDIELDSYPGMLDKKPIKQKKAADKADECIHKRKLHIKCVAFVKEVTEIMQLLPLYDVANNNASSLDELHDKFQPLIVAIAHLLDISFRFKGQSKMHLTTSEYPKDSKDNLRMEREVVCRPDYVLTNSDGSILMPVEICNTATCSTIKTSHKRKADLSTSQESKHADKTFYGQHAFQHIGLIYEKIIKNKDVITRRAAFTNKDKEYVSVGMFFSKNMLHFSKVKTTVGHMRSCFHRLWPATHESVEITSLHMKRIHQEHEKTGKGIQVIKSGWQLDFARGVHRNALLLFLVHYIYGYDLDLVSSLDYTF